MAATNRRRRKVVFTALHGKTRLKRFSLSKNEPVVFAREVVVGRDRLLEFYVGR